jgi:branched-chain amino acid transport system ATP-binding protein
LFNLVAGDFKPTTGKIELMGRDVTNWPARRRPGLGLSRTYQKSRLFPGLSVEDNLYLAVLGREGGRMRPFRTSRDAAFRRRAREAAERVWLGDELSTPVGSLSHGEQRQLEVGMAGVTEPKLMMLDEPASGLSRGEREKLTELLLRLDPSVTLILIEHDMDVALTVAQRVTMMFEGEKIVEGTPSEIRANQLVHDIYLGSRYHDE